MSTISSTGKNKVKDMVKNMAKVKNMAGVKDMVVAMIKIINW